MKLVTIVGARPQFVKAAAVSRELRKHHQEILVHTGQHYDYGMSGIFFDGLDLPQAEVNLGVGSGSHGTQTGAMLKRIEDVLIAEQPDCVLVYGDTNSTLAGALAGSKLCLPVVHVEAGLRSFNRRVPEEINRIVVDHVSNVLLCPSKTAVDNLASEGIGENVHMVGDVMLDVLKWARQRAEASTGEVLKRCSLTPGSYLLATVHRSENTDDVSRFTQIIEGFNMIAEPIIFPIHPRTRKVLNGSNICLAPHVRPVDPVGYLDMVALAGSARMVLTDSGGLQKEAYWLGVPCVTLRAETEWVETVNAGWNILAGSNAHSIVNAVRRFNPTGPRPGLYGEGSAAKACVSVLSGNLPALMMHQKGWYVERQVPPYAAGEQKESIL